MGRYRKLWMVLVTMVVLGCSAVPRPGTDWERTEKAFVLTRYGKPDVVSVDYGEFDTWSEFWFYTKTGVVVVYRYRSETGFVRREVFTGAN